MSDFNERYWAAQHPDVRALRNADAKDRQELAISLATRGFVIDTPIMVWGWDPEMTMRLRKEYGYTWVPSALQPPVTLAPGLWFPGMPSYDERNIPPGAVKVSVDPADYPPYEPPRPDPRGQSYNPVGIATGFAFEGLPVHYSAAPLFGTDGKVLAMDDFRDGFIFADQRGQFRKRLFGTGQMTRGFWLRLG